jgi:hypothetical protein
MEGSGAGAIWSPRAARPAALAAVVSAARGALLAGGVLAGGALAARRLLGQLAEPLPAPALWGLGALLAVWLWLTLGGSAWGRGQTPTWSRLWPMLPALAAGLAVSLPGSSAWGLAGLWGGVLAVGWASGWRAAPGHRLPPEGAAGQAAHDAEPGSRAHVVQSLVRRESAEGCQVEGWVRVSLAPGQRGAAAHVAFCPPLPGLLECEAEPWEGPAAEVRVDRLLPYGARLMVRLESPAGAEGATVQVGFVATAIPVAPE